MSFLKTLKKAAGRRLVSFEAALNYLRWFELRYLRSANPLREGERLLDVACGIGVFSASLGRNGAETYGFDTDKSSIRLAAVLQIPRASFFLADAHAIPVGDRRFDVVASVCALEHFADDKAALAEMRRILKPSGHLLLTVDSLSQPFLSDAYRARHAAAHAVLRYYTRESLARRLEEAGFSILDSRYLITTRGATALARAALRFASKPALFRFVSILAIPAGLACELLAGNDRWGFTLGVTARRRGEP